MQDYSQLYATAQTLKETALIEIAGVIITAIVAVFLLMIALTVIRSLFTAPASQRQRSRMTDLYVIGMIRKFAKEDSINLDDELIELKRLEALERNMGKNLDKVVEEKLKQRIMDTTEGKLEEKKK